MTTGARAFRAVAEGFRLWLKDEKTLIIWTGTAWATYPYASAAETLTRTASFAASPTIAGALYRCDATAAAIIASLPPRYQRERRHPDAGAQPASLQRGLR